MRPGVFRHVFGVTVVLALGSGVVAELIHTVTLSLAEQQLAAAHGRHSSTLSGRHIILYPPDIPAITPTLRVTGASQAAFTVAAMRSYFVANPVATVDGSAPQTVRIGFMTADQASKLLDGEWIGRPATALVGFVEFAGNISTSAVSPPASLANKVPSVMHFAWAIFDTQTGNALLGGSGDNAPGS